MATDGKPSRISKGGTGVRDAQRAATREATKTKVIDRLKGIGSSLAASGAIVDARWSRLVIPAKPRRLRRSAKK